jgi:uncharacterized protein YkwD
MIVSPATTVPATTRRFRGRLVPALLAVGVAGSLIAAPVTMSSASAATPSAATGRSYATAMLKTLNAERKSHHLGALKMNTKLIASAHSHNLTMARTNTMAHQERGEAAFSTRITRAGYSWRAAGENIGWNSVQTNAGLQSLEKSMFAEKAPNDGHRRNILNGTYRDIGIDVYFDKTHHKMWFTQDLGRTR